MNRDDDETTPDGITMIDTHNSPYDTNDTFSIALYSRIHNVIDTIEEPYAPDLTPQHNPQHNKEHEHTLSPTFVSRIKEKLKHSCVSTVSKSAPTTTFLDKAEKQLQNHYDRVLSNETLIDSKLIENSPFCEQNALEALNQKNLHTVPYPMVKKSLEELVQETIRQYKTFFENEQDIIEMATRYDNLRTWLKHTKEMFNESQIQLSEKAQHNYQDKIQNIISNTNWHSLFEKAKEAWIPLSINRNALQELHNIIGGAMGCRICFNNQVKTLLVPCGHVLCESCVERIDKCPFCHSSFYAKQSIYFM